MDCLLSELKRGKGGLLHGNVARDRLNHHEHLVSQDRRDDDQNRLHHARIKSGLLGDGKDYVIRSDQHNSVQYRDVDNDLHGNHGVDCSHHDTIQCDEVHRGGHHGAADKWPYNSHQDSHAYRSCSSTTSDDLLGDDTGCKIRNSHHRNILHLCDEDDDPHDTLHVYH